MTPARSVYVALLRAVNVGGQGKVPMAELRAWCGDLGYDDVVTYIQSGNVVFRASATDEGQVSSALADRIEQECGVRTSVMVRRTHDLESVMDDNPFLAPGVEPRTLHVAFLADTPSGEAIAGLDPDRSPPDQFAVDGRHVYLHYPDGSGRSKLTNDYLERGLGTVSTARNWNTVTKLVDLARAAGA